MADDRSSWATETLMKKKDATISTFKKKLDDLQVN
jgi:hypothetical protein